MAGSLLIPVGVSAKVITTPTNVPKLGEAPFNREAVLEPGVHVHWALPDALTQARVITDDSPNAALLPGVPDLWLVTRSWLGMQPIGGKPKTFWRAWVVDSRTETATPLDQWTPPTKSPGKLVYSPIHTAVGVLPSAGTLAPGWGVWTAGQGAFDPLVAAYYPACEKRLGFHDALDAPAPKTGKIGYTVVGWYSSPEHDPLWNAQDRQELLERWNLAHNPEPTLFDEVATLTLAAAESATHTSPSAAASLAATWQPAWIDVSESIATPAYVQAVTRAGQRGGTHNARHQQTETMRKLIPEVQVASGGLHTVVEAVRASNGPHEIRCHGSVAEVPLAESTTDSAPIPTENLRLYPSVKRAMADIASKNETEDNVEYVEMLLQDIDAQKDTLAGVLDYPGAAHAATFQGVPGKSSYYARIDVYARQRAASTAGKFFDLLPEASNENRVGSGHWPSLTERSASSPQDPNVSEIPPSVLRHPSAATPEGPSQTARMAWINDVRNVFTIAKAAAAAAGTPIDDRLVRVHDYRSDARPVNLGQQAPGRNSDSSGYLLDIEDDVALGALLRSTGGADVHLPDSKNLYELPGPRWYRPWAPQIVLLDAHRSYRYGYDGRFREDGFLHTRMSGETVTGLVVGPSPVIQGGDLLVNSGGLSVAGLPPEARALVQEALLFDTASASVMASLTVASTQQAGELAEAEERCRAGIHGTWLGRDSKLSAAEIAALGKVLPIGIAPSPVAMIPWKDPRDPLFLDVSYSLLHSPTASLSSDWELKSGHVDLIRKSPPTSPAAVSVTVFQERTPVTATIPKVLESALITKMTLDSGGNLVKAQSLPEGVDEYTFKTMDVVSAPLTAFDALAFAEGLGERSGALRLNKLDLVDTFGFSRPWTSGIAPTSTQGGPSSRFLIEMTPRLPFWARLNFRLQAAEDPNEEASTTAPPICGILVPDFLEHTLEVFDGNGNAIGQVSTDRPQFGSTSARTLAVRFDVHPWVAAQLGLNPVGNPLEAIASPVLRSFVTSLVAQSREVPAGVPDSPQPQNWFETGLTAMLRVIDTIRGTLDPSVKTQDRKTRMIGEPILVLSARASLEGTATTNLTDLTKSPTLIATTSPVPDMLVRIGDVTRPDDGVLGCFLTHENPADGRFVPVAKEAADGALFNGLNEGVGLNFPNGLKTSHPFVEDASEFLLKFNQKQDIIVLADVRGSLYATCGVLPRKKITIPREFVDAAVANLEPTFRVGPVMTFRRKETVKPIIPPPQIEGLVSEFVYARSASDGSPAAFSETPIPPVPPVAELPPDRVVLDEGWVRVFKQQT